MRSSPFVVCIVLALAGLSTTATGEDKKTSAKTPPPALIVWTTETAIKEGTALLEARQFDLAAKYAACIVTPGTHAVFMTGGYAAFPVMIIDGKERGCRGYVTRATLEHLVIKR